MSTLLQGPGESVSAAERQPKAILSDVEAGLVDRYWRAANYLSVGQRNGSKARIPQRLD